MMQPYSIAVVCSDPAQLANSEHLAEQLGLPLARSGERHLLLRRSPEGLELFKPGDPGLAGSVRVDFTSGAAAFRRRQQGRELLLRATGCKGNFLPAVVDATGGLGRDSFVLAAAGCRVQVFERMPVIAALLADGIERARLHPETAAIAERMQLIVGDAAAALGEMKEQTARSVAVVYLDPMFSERRKSALAKKELQLLQLLAPPDPAADKLLLNAALAAAGNRVVVKRSVRAPFLAGLAPSHSLAGKTVRFDVYLVGSRRRQLDFVA